MGGKIINMLYQNIIFKKLFGRGKKSRDAAHDDLEMKARCLAYRESCIPIQ